MLEVQDLPYLIDRANDYWQTGAAWASQPFLFWHLIPNKTSDEVSVVLVNWFQESVLAGVLWVAKYTGTDRSLAFKFTHFIHILPTSAREIQAASLARLRVAPVHEAVPESSVRDDPRMISFPYLSTND